jgi:transcriptional regulatory protein LEU3
MSTLNIEKYRQNSRDRSAESAVAFYLSPGKKHSKGIRAQISLASGQDSNCLSPPDIVKHCGLYPEDISDLFTMFVMVFMILLTHLNSCGQIFSKN